MSLTAAIIGRPNVGKSTLFNRLTATRGALVHDTPGVTRDRQYGKARLGRVCFTLVDTAGLEEAKEGSLASRMTHQTLQALKTVDLVMMVIDGRSGVMPEDQHFASLVRRSGRPAILIVNKAEGGKIAASVAEAYRLGLGEPVAMSAEHGLGLAELAEAIAERAEQAGIALDVAAEEKPRRRRPKKTMAAEESEPLPVPESVMQIAIVGRPNTGKSTLLNALIGEERVLTGPEAGVTRDAIAVDYTYQGRALKLIDTAGMRRKSNVVETLEKMSVGDALHAIQYAHVVVVALDAEMPLEKQDNAIASLVESEGRALVIALNKWDRIAEKQAYLKGFYQRLAKVLAQAEGVAVVPVSALHNKHLGKLMEACFDAYELWNTHIGTGALNRWLGKMIEKHSPPLVDGRRLKIRYITQAKIRPPSFILFTNQVENFPEDYKRYLIGGLRKEFGLQGVPIRITLRKGDNPYAKDKKA